MATEQYDNSIYLILNHLCVASLCYILKTPDWFLSSAFELLSAPPLPRDKHIHLPTLQSIDVGNLINALQNKI